MMSSQPWGIMRSSLQLLVLYRASSSLHIKDPAFHQAVIDHDTNMLKTDKLSESLLLIKLDIPTWLRLYALAREGMALALFRVSEVATNFRKI